MKPTLLVLAAGMGSRYGGNKQLDEVGPSGETIIDYSIYDAIQCRIRKDRLCDTDAILRSRLRNDLLRSSRNRIDVDYVFQEITNLPEGVKVAPDRAKPWGTSHAILVTRDKIKEPFGVINC